MLVVVLLTATTAAFALTEGLKLEKSPVLSPRITKVFSPVCECSKDRALISFKLRKGAPGDARGRGRERATSCARSCAGRGFRAGWLELAWDGRDDAGQVVRDGDYKPRVRLADAHKTITVPNDMRVDTKPPEIQRFSGLAACALAGRRRAGGAASRCRTA